MFIFYKKSIDYFIGIKRLFFLLDFICDLKYFILALSVESILIGL